MVCDIYNKDVFAWPTNDSQFSLAVRNITDPKDSPLYKKKIKVKCMDKNDLTESGLNNG